MTLLPLEFLVDVDAWQILGQNETYVLYFLPLPLFKKRFRATDCGLTHSMRVERILDGVKGIIENFYFRDILIRNPKKWKKMSPYIGSFVVSEKYAKG